jgi:hypothetical protein
MEQALTQPGEPQSHCMSYFTLTVNPHPLPGFPAPQVVLLWCLSATRKYVVHAFALNDSLTTPLPVVSSHPREFTQSLLAQPPVRTEMVPLNAAESKFMVAVTCPLTGATKRQTKSAPADSHALV